jgi:hypothetical protein
LEVPPGHGGAGIFIAHLLIQEEALAFKAFEEWFKEGIRQAAEKVRGFYGLEGILLNLQELPGWHLPHFVTLLTQHASKLQTGEKKLIRYGGFIDIMTAWFPWVKAGTAADIRKIDGNRKGHQMNQAIGGINNRTGDSDAKPFPRFCIFRPLSFNPGHGPAPDNIFKSETKFASGFSPIPLLFRPR